MKNKGAKMTERFLPITKEEIEERGWVQPGFILISGDAYVDHLSFGVAKDRAQ